MQAVAVPKTLLRSITTEMTRPATSERRNPKKVPGVWLFPTESIACPAAAKIVLFVLLVDRLFLSERLPKRSAVPSKFAHGKSIKNGS
jgi:hypothetical protein